MTNYSLITYFVDEYGTCMVNCGNMRIFYKKVPHSSPKTYFDEISYSIFCRNEMFYTYLVQNYFFK